MVGKKFTWSRGNSRSRIDWALCHSDWFYKYPGLSLLGLPKNFSNHNPLLLNLEGKEDWGPKPFRSIYVWLKDPRFKPLISSTYKDLSHLSLPLKLKALKWLIKQWNGEVFGSIDEKIRSAQSQLHSLDLLTDSGPLNEEHLNKEKSLKSELLSWTNRKAQVLRQYYRCQNITSKDSNSKYFHSLANFRMRKNYFHQLRFGGRLIKGKVRLSQHIRAHFHQHYQQPYIPRITLLLGSFRMIDPETANLS